MTLDWTVGNGTRRAVFAMQISSGGSTSAIPIDGITYTADPIFGHGTQIGTSGWFCIYNGTGTSTTITGLTPNANYRFMACEYNGLSGSEFYNTDTTSNNPNEIQAVPVADWAIYLGIFLIGGFIVFSYKRRHLA
jgi:hypothetical protein